MTEGYPVWLPMFPDCSFGEPLPLPPYPHECDVRLALANWASENGVKQAIAYKEDGSVELAVEITKNPQGWEYAE